MALIMCPECKKEISDQATACPNCGSPLKAAAVPKMEVVTNPVNSPVIQLELTAKRWEKVILFTWAMLVVGFLMFGIFGSQNSEAGKWLGVNIMIVSVPVWITGKIGAWYSNR